jgi:hypothetical protein
MKELDTKRGMSAFKYYRAWFKARRLRIPNKDTFVVSKMYNTFFKFAVFAKDMGIPDTTLYIKFMVKNTVMPAHWYNSDIYNYFMDSFDKDYDPMTHVRITFTSIERISKALDCKMGDVFSHLHPSDVIKLIQSRNLSPWVLLLSKKFAAFLKNDVNAEERKLIEDVIKLNRWETILENQRSRIPEIKKYVAQLDL